MKPVFGLAAAAAMLLAGPLGAEPWSLPRSDVQVVTAPDGHAYRLLVAWPGGKAPAEGWPVLWMLDGEDNFAIATMTARRLARAGARSGVEPGVIVAVESGPLPRRVLDYTPPTPGYAIPAGFPAHGMETGGGDAFLDLVDAQLRPLVSARLPVDPFRQTLAGHSFGGLLALHAMFAGRHYSRFVAVSPSLWFGEDMLKRRERDADKDSAASLLIVTSPDEAGPNAGTGSAAEALVARWKRRGNPARFLSMPGHGHGSTMLAAMAATIVAAFGTDSSGKD